MSEHLCPCCGHEVPEQATPQVLIGLKVSPMERRVLDHLISIYPRTASARAIADAIYHDDPGGGPDGAESCVAVFVSHLRGKVRVYGWDMGGGRGWRGSYGLRRIEADAA